MAFRGTLKSPLNAVVGLASSFLCMGFLWGAYGYGLGTVDRMGPGFFPAAVGAVGLVLSLAVLASAFRTPEAPGQGAHLRPALFILTSVVVFAITIDLFGLIPAIFITGVIAALGDTRTRLHEAAAIGAIMALGIWVVFVLLLNLPIDALRLG